MTDELDVLITDAVESGIVQGLIPAQTADRMRARLIKVLGGEGTANGERDHQDDCLMCAVRALTEGDPAVNWVPTEENKSVSGVVLRMGEVVSNFGMVPSVDLWMGGHGRIRVRAFAGSLRHALDQASVKVGDRLTVNYDGTRETKTRFGMKPYKMFSASVQRGH